MIEDLMKEFYQKYAVEPNLLMINIDEFEKLCSQHHYYLKHDESKDIMTIFGMRIHIVRFGKTEVYYDYL